MVSEEYQNEILRTTLANHQYGWELVQEQLSENKHIESFVAPGFVLDDYFPETRTGPTAAMKNSFNSSKACFTDTIYLES